jgi:hypothetical protein
MLVESLKTEGEQRYFQYEEEFGDEPDLEPSDDDAVTVVVYGANTALLAAIEKLGGQRVG